MIHLVSISGSLRRESSNRALLRAAAALAPPGVRCVPYEGLGALPHFDPDLDLEQDDPPPAVASLRKLLIDAGGILISTPEYAHGLPGAFKNMLDWLVSTGELVGKPVAALNASPAGGEYAQASLVEILRTMNWRLIEDGCLLQPFLPRKVIDGLPDQASVERVRSAMQAFVSAIGQR